MAGPVWEEPASPDSDFHRDDWAEDEDDDGDDDFTPEQDRYERQLDRGASQ